MRLGFPPGDWPAKILPTGEVVPTTVVPISVSVQGSNVVVQWPADGYFFLEAATNLAGPFQEVFVPNPYTNNILQFPQRFFRVRPVQ